VTSIQVVALEGGLELAWRYLPWSTALPRPNRAVRVSRLRSFRDRWFLMSNTESMMIDCQQLLGCLPSRGRCE
jgi:hypothetical protein